MAGAALSALGHESVVTAGTLTIPGQPMSHRTRRAMEAHGLAAPVRGLDGLRASVGIVTLDGVIDEDVVAPRVIAAADEVAARLG